MEQALSHFPPGDPFDSTCFQLFDPAPDLGVPSLLDVLVLPWMKALDQGTGYRCAILLIQGKRLLQDFFG